MLGSSGGLLITEKTSDNAELSHWCWWSERLHRTWLMCSSSSNCCSRCADNEAFSSLRLCFSLTLSIKKKPKMAR